MSNLSPQTQRSRPRTLRSVVGVTAAGALLAVGFQVATTESASAVSIEGAPIGEFFVLGAGNACTLTVVNTSGTTKEAQAVEASLKRAPKTARVTRSGNKVTWSSVTVNCDTGKPYTATASAPLLRQPSTTTNASYTTAATSNSAPAFAATAATAGSSSATTKTVSLASYSKSGLNVKAAAVTNDWRTFWAAMVGVAVTVAVAVFAAPLFEAAALALGATATAATYFSVAAAGCMGGTMAQVAEQVITKKSSTTVGTKVAVACFAGIAGGSVVKYSSRMIANAGGAAGISQALKNKVLDFIYKRLPFAVPSGATYAGEAAASTGAISSAMVTSAGAAANQIANLDSIQIN